MNTRDQRNKFIIVAVILLVIASVVYYVLQNIQNRGKYSVGIVSVPSDALVIFKNDGGSFETKGDTIYLVPGEYDVSAQKDGFETHTTKIVVTESGQRIALPLLPVSDEAMEWAKKNSRAYTEAERIAGELAQQSGEQFRQNNPILGNLPHDSGYYKIDYGQDGDNVILYITADQSLGRQVAIAKIREWGYQPSDYRIIFRNFTNPFEKAAQ